MRPTCVQVHLAGALENAKRSGTRAIQKVTAQLQRLRNELELTATPLRGEQRAHAELRAEMQRLRDEEAMVAQIAADSGLPGPQLVPQVSVRSQRHSACRRVSLGAVATSAHAAAYQRIPRRTGGGGHISAPNEPRHALM